ncbi:MULTISPECIES: DNA-binding protein WhiA [Trueperella]|uniref:Probable cell division protein WhiA n=1 Tax=Trueperella bernardiae TaxID=59561 RepID=A0A0W1KND0_9ACTO|nr:MULTISPECIES: DNA-binding protein WhiA [Trueperella]KTF05024.1 putative sporulation transcription regulator WhiA [Trueperella bernardiae]MCM3906628.1 DNA-binding protein WhiA [Trueperella bernardiae]MDK8601129.1 DNA-binding protein WhiA [Trueperella bernardiae]MDV6237961.1 DNA-binding protein WhiA [Trueperella bernardiae]OCW60912.1 sporulation protein [Trueperella bernardiae]
MPPLTVTLKDELSAVFPRTASSMTAEVSVMFRFAGGLQINDGVVTLQAELDHPGAARHMCELIKAVFSVDADLVVVKNSGRAGNTYVVRITKNGERIARRLGLLDTLGRPVRGLPAQIVGGSKADAAAAWRGAFLARGSLMEPGRNAALELTCPSLEAAYGIGGLARRLESPYRAREARGAYRVDIREGDAISDMLSRMGSNDGVLLWEDLRTEREVHGQANRLANFDDANMRRSADAAVVAVIRVKRAFEILGEEVPDNLREVGKFRMQYPEDSLNMLGGRLNPPATKDAVAGRLRRLNTMADKRAAELGIPDTMDAVSDVQHRL